MKLSRHTFLSGTCRAIGTAGFLGIALSSLLIAGCSGGSGGSDENLVPVNPNYSVSRTITSPNGKVQAVTYARPGEAPRTVIYRSVGDDRFVSQPLDASEPQVTTVFEGRDDYLFWSPQSDKVYYITSSRVADTDQWMTQFHFDTLVPSPQSSMPFNFLSNSATNTMLSGYNRGRDTNTRFYPAGFSADGSELLYLREVTSERGVLTTKFAYNYRTTQTREMPL